MENDHIDEFVAVDNLTALRPIDVKTVLSCLEERYNNGIVYTNGGSTVIAVNPFKELPDLYTDELIEQYQSEQSLPPHIYNIAHRAHKGIMLQYGKINQCIIVSGESGAGKTVTAKHLLKYLIVVSSDYMNNCQPCEDKTGCLIERRIMDSNPILEAFGNAVTPRNNNSSRFGKFIQSQFQRTGSLSGASIKTYLLEKTRIAHQSEDECNFHIFYQLADPGCPISSDTEISKLQEELMNTRFKVLPYSQDISENRDITCTVQALLSIGIDKDNILGIFQVLAAILHLGNIEFIPVEEESSFLDNDSDLDMSAMEFTVTESALIKASSLLGIEREKLEEVLLHRNIQSGKNARRSVFVKPVTIMEAYSRLNCLMMVLYSRIFDWLVSFINSQIQSKGNGHSIGLLDIYGFEKFTENSLEQLCINYANEKLQQHYIKHFLRDLQLEYEEECIQWDHILYTENQPCLSMLEGKPSIFGVLNEEVYLNRKSNDKMLADRIGELRKTYRHLKSPKLSSFPGFLVQHYAGEVKYSTKELVVKNKDNIPPELIQLLCSSEMPYVSDLFSDFVIDDSPGKKKKTVLTKFKSSLDDLLTVMETSDVHYIRCIKPNPLNKPDICDKGFITSQLEAGGILETVEISKQTYSARFLYDDFVQRYGVLLRGKYPSTYRSSSEEDAMEDDTLFDPLDHLLKKQLGLPSTPKRTPTPRKKMRRRTGLSSAEHTRKCCAYILKLICHQGNSQAVVDTFRHQFGVHKIFLTQEQFDALEVNRKELFVQYAERIQRYWHYYQFRKSLQNIRAAIKYLQKAIRHWLRRKNSQASIKLLVQEKRKMDEQRIQEENRKREEKIRKQAVPARAADRKRSLELESCVAEKKVKISSSENTSSKPKIMKYMSGKCRDDMVDRSRHKENSPDVCEPPNKKLKTFSDLYDRLTDISLGDGIISRRRLPKVPIRIHTRPSVLKNAHIMNQKELQCSLADCIPDNE